MCRRAFFSLASCLILLALYAGAMREVQAGQVAAHTTHMQQEDLLHDMDMEMEMGMDEYVNEDASAHELEDTIQPMFVESLSELRVAASGKPKKSSKKATKPKAAKKPAAKKTSQPKAKPATAQKAVKGVAYKTSAEHLKAADDFTAKSKSSAKAGNAATALEQQQLAKWHTTQGKALLKKEQADAKKKSATKPKAAKKPAATKKPKAASVANSTKPVKAPKSSKAKKSKKQTSAVLPPTHSTANSTQTQKASSDKKKKAKKPSKSAKARADLAKMAANPNVKRTVNKAGQTILTANIGKGKGETKRASPHLLPGQYCPVEFGGSSLLSLHSTAQQQGMQFPAGVPPLTAQQLAKCKEDHDKWMAARAAGQKGVSTLMAGGGAGYDGGAAGKSGGAAGKSGGAAGKTGGAAGKKGGASGKTGGASGKVGGASGKVGGASGKTGGASGKTGGWAGYTGAASGKRGGDAGYTGAASGKKGGDSGYTGAASGKKGGDAGYTGLASGKKGGDAGYNATASGKKGGHLKFAGPVSPGTAQKYKLSKEDIEKLKTRMTKTDAVQGPGKYRIRNDLLRNISATMEVKQGDNMLNKLKRNNGKGAFGGYGMQNGGVTDQGSCASCWAQAAIATAQTEMKLKRTFKGLLSAQQLIDCVYPGKMQKGCAGGNPADALAYMRNHPVALAKDYPPNGPDYTPGTCKVDLIRKAVKTPPLADKKNDDTSGAWRQNSDGRVYDAAKVDANKNPQTDLMKTQCIDGKNCAKGQALQEPTLAGYIKSGRQITTYVDASNWAMYTGGVFNATQCSNAPAMGNHLVTITGFDANARVWIVQNSWGVQWGENGFIKLPYGVNACGLANFVKVA